jgi:hypothetical protein
MPKLVIASFIAAAAVGAFMRAEERISQAELATTTDSAMPAEPMPPRWQDVSWASCDWVDGLYRSVRVCN